MLKIRNITAIKLNEAATQADKVIKAYLETEGCWTADYAMLRYLADEEVQKNFID